MSGAPTKIAVVPIFSLSAGQERLGTPSSDVPVGTGSGSITGGAVCGNSVVESGEACDPSGSITANVCTSPQGLTGYSTCSAQCTFSTTCYCYSDFSGDDFLDYDDYDQFSNCYQNATTCPAGHNADCNKDGAINAQDQTCFSDLFGAGTCHP